MTARIYVAAGVLAVMASACSPIVGQTKASADLLMEQGKFADADARYESVMNGAVTQREYDKLVAARCETRLEFAKQQVASFNASNTATNEDIDRLHTYVRRCPGFGAVDQQITDVGVAVTERRLRAEADPMVAAGDTYGALDLAAELSRFLPSTHMRFAWIEEQRAKLAAQHAAGHAREAASNPLAAAVFARLHNRTGATPPVPESLGSLAEAQLAVGPQNDFVGEVGPDCAARAGRPRVAARVAPHPYELVAVNAFGCTAEVSISPDVETYTEKVQVVKKVPYQIAVSRPVTTRHTTVYRSCSTSSNGFGSGCVTSHSSTTTSTRTETTSVTAYRDELVWVDEPRTRPIKRAAAHARGRVTASVVGFGGQRSQTVDVEVHGEPVQFPGDTPDDSIRARLTAGSLNNALAVRLDGAAAEAANTAARALRLEQLGRQVDEQLAMGNVSGAREIAIARWAGGAAVLPAEVPLLDEHFGVAISSDPPTAMPAVGTYAWLSESIEADLFQQDPRASDFDGLLVTGYPTSVAGFAGGYRQPETGLLAQPDRGGVDFVLDSGFRYSLTTGRYHRGLGLMVGADMGVSIGRRTGDDYERLVPLPPYVDAEDAKEGRVTLGMQFSALAMLGVRTYFIGLFAGLKPTYTNFSIGHFFSEGGTLPLAGRLELRFLERSPIIVEGWWGHLGKADRRQLGGTVQLPIGRGATDMGLWLQGRFEQYRLPARIPGLFEKDDVLLDGATTTAGSVGIGMGF